MKIVSAWMTFTPSTFLFMFSGNFQSSKGVAGFLLRISFGLALLFHGIALYMDFDGFMGKTRGGLGPLEPLGAIWAYILPALMIIGGALFTVGMYRRYATWATGVALASIPIGMMVKPVLSGAASGDMMGATINAFIWWIVFFMVLKYGNSCCCSSSCCTPGNGASCGCGSCGPNGGHKH